MLNFSNFSFSGKRLENFVVYKERTFTSSITVLKKGDRKYQRFFFIIKGTATFEIDDGKTITASEGSILYLPVDCTYTCSWEYDDEIDYALIIFNLFDKDDNVANLNDTICLACMDTNGEILQKCEELIGKWFKSASTSIACMRMFFEVLELIQKYADEEFETTSKSTYIAKKYLDSNFIEDINISDLAKMCNMSLTSFRRNFKKDYGTSPLKYKNYLKAKKAKVMLSTADYSISEISSALNLCDIYYFSKLFKATFGITPAQFRAKRK